MYQGYLMLVLEETVLNKLCLLTQNVLYIYYSISKYLLMDQTAPKYPKL